MKRTAEIAGAGFAGLAAAAALARRGWAVRVHEMASEPRSFGAGIYVHPFAQDVLREIGAFAALEAAACAPATRSIHIDGVRRSVSDTHGRFLTTTRAVLHRAVLDAALQAGAEIVTRSCAAGADAAGALILDDGRRIGADLVIAADGVRSAIATRLGIVPQRVEHPDAITRVLLAREGLREPDWDGIHDFYDYRVRPLRVLYTPCGKDAFYFCLMAPAGDAPANALPVDAALWSRSFPMLAPALRRVGTLGRNDRYTTTSLARWSVGHVAFIGDAAHAMPSSLAQGAGVGMQNALALAKAVDAAADLRSGLHAWERHARPLVERWQRHAEQIAGHRSLATAIHPGADFAGESPEGFPLLQAAPHTQTGETSWTSH